MILSTWGDMLTSSFRGLWGGVISFLPNLVIAIIILCIGWAVGALVSKAIEQFMKSIKFDEALGKAGLEDVVKRSGINLNSGKFVGGLVKYFIIVAFLIVSLEILKLNQVTSFLQQIVIGYLPQVIIAVLILLVSGVVGDILSKIVTASAKTANLSSANTLGVIAKWAVWIFAILVALSQMGIAGAFIQTLFTGFVVAVSLALGISFGLGGQTAAARAIEKVQHDISHH
ncbi:MAG: hypothetical protein WAZ44_00180 [Minisyncoccia bacterium]